MRLGVLASAQGDGGGWGGAGSARERPSADVVHRDTIARITGFDDETTTYYW
ncbi:hypothetical protein ACQI5H_22840 [Mycobacterium heidelbergense]|uniref:hypothetical protein n=1 Tax=Mycobacterium heidelbergense TaxID=53376 RepID=UPI003CF4ABE7